MSVQARTDAPPRGTKERAGRGGRPAQQGSMRDLGRAIRFLGHYRRPTTIAYVAMFLSLGAQLLVPLMVQRILDTVARGAAVRQLAAAPAAMQAELLRQAGLTAEQAATMGNPETALLWAAGLIVLFAIARGLFSFAQTFMAETASQGVAFDLRNALFAKIQRLSFSYHDRNRTGQLMIRATDDVEKVRMFIGQGLMMATGALVLLVVALALLLATNWRLMLIVAPVLPVAMIAFFLFGTITQPLFAKVQARISALNTVLQESLQGIKVVKAFAREPHQQASFDRAATDLMAQQIRVSAVMSFLFPVVFLISMLGQNAVLYFGGRQIINGTLTVGEWQLFSMYLVFVFFPLGQLGMIISQMSQASASAHRIFEIVDTRNEVVDKPGAAELPPVQGRVAFEDVSFRYFGSSEPVLSHITFAASPGETVAILGATGSGKSSIINLIPRFYDVSEGRITVDGHDIRDVTIESLRTQIGIVLQETNLFTGTIRDNIAFGKPNASDAEVEAAARAAAAHDFIMSFPEGYRTPVGERGTTLSGGQKQRVAIARALLLNPRILILDDSTSSVDVATEAVIQHALDRLMQGRTSFVIAQRISTVLNANRILVLEKGRIAAEGRHEELLEESAIYADIYRSQLVEDAAPLHEDELTPLPVGPAEAPSGATNGATNGAANGATTGAASGGVKQPATGAAAGKEGPQ